MLYRTCISMPITGMIQVCCNLRGTPADCRDSGPAAVLGSLYLYNVNFSPHTNLFAKEDTEHILSYSGGRLLERIHSDNQIVLSLV